MLFKILVFSLLFFVHLKSIHNFYHNDKFLVCQIIRLKKKKIWRQQNCTFKLFQSLNLFISFSINWQISVIRLENRNVTSANFDKIYYNFCKNTQTKHLCILVPALKSLNLIPTYLHQFATVEYTNAENAAICDIFALYLVQI